MDESEKGSGIVDAARDGDQDAWETLYRGVYPRLHAYLARRVGYDRAEEAVSETMARAMEGIDRFTLGPAGFDGWVFGIARRVSADHYRREDRDERYKAAIVIAGGAVGVGPEPGEKPLHGRGSRPGAPSIRLPCAPKNRNCSNYASSPG